RKPSGTSNNYANRANTRKPSGTSNNYANRANTRKPSGTSNNYANRANTRKPSGTSNNYANRANTRNKPSSAVNKYVRKPSRTGNKFVASSKEALGKSTGNLKTAGNRPISKANSTAKTSSGKIKSSTTSKTALATNAGSKIGKSAAQRTNATKGFNLSMGDLSNSAADLGNKFKDGASDLANLGKNSVGNVVKTVKGDTVTTTTIQNAGGIMNTEIASVTNKVGSTGKTILDKSTAGVNWARNEAGKVASISSGNPTTTFNGGGSKGNWNYMKEKGGSAVQTIWEKGTAAGNTVKEKAPLLGPWVGNKTKYLPENTSKQWKNFPRDANKTGVIADTNIRREAGRPWMEAVKYPYDRQIAKAQQYQQNADNHREELVNTIASSEGDFAPADDKMVDYSDVKANGGTYTGNDISTAVNAPNGGTIRYPIGDAFEGKQIKIAAAAVIEKGTARIVVVDNTGKVVSQGEWFGKDDTKITKISSPVMETPNDRQAKGYSDSGSYTAVLELGKDSKIDFYGIGMGVQ
ncbi:MAG: hypothetical protein WCJ35_16985, partial [Planctomycetota bacterium]